MTVNNGVTPGFTLHTGCVFSGKTEALIKELNETPYKKYEYLLIRPASEKKKTQNQVTTHSGMVLIADPIQQASDVLYRDLSKFQIIAFDAMQFFDIGIVDVVRKLVRDGKRVIGTGINLTWEEKPFGSMPLLLTYATSIETHMAVCSVCGEGNASRSQRIVDSTEEMLIGNNYHEARCVEHYVTD